MMSDKKLDQLLIADEVAKILRIKLDGDFVIKAYLNPLDMNGIQQQTPIEGVFTNWREGLK
jgi:hypothetical protein